MNFNQILKERREKPFARNYPCACRMQCIRFGGAEVCDNCSYCGTDMDREAELASSYEDNPKTVSYYQDTRL